MAGALVGLDPVLDRAAKAGATAITGPFLADNPPNGKARHPTFIAPSGVMFELFEPPPIP